MGNNICSQETSLATTIPPQHEETVHINAEESIDFGNTDAVESEDEPTPLKAFISSHSAANPICASNQLCFNT
jgi:hypothetical protein